MGASKILVVDATGYIGKHVVTASAKLGHPTFALVRSTTSSHPAKAKLLKSFTDAGVTLLVGDLSNHASLLSALKQVDVVISTVGGAQLLDQTKLLEAIKEAGTIKRFFPSEFGNDVDQIELDVAATKGLFGAKHQIWRLVESSGIPFTNVIAGSYAGYYLAPIVQDAWTPPREGKLTIYGDGNAKAIFVEEPNVAIFTIKSVDDPRAENKNLHIILKENVASQNEVTIPILVWAKMAGGGTEYLHPPSYISRKRQIPARRCPACPKLPKTLPACLPSAGRTYVRSPSPSAPSIARTTFAP